MNTATTTRRLLISMARKRQRPGSGSGREFLIRRTTEMRFPDLAPVFGAVQWCTVGAAATRLYMPERMTADMDVLVHQDDANAAEHQLLNAGYIRQSNLSIGGSRWLS